jgi:hypothetical protein
MQAASLLDGLSFDGCPPFKYSRSSTEVDVSRRQVVQALVVSTVVVVLDELVDAVFELTWQIVVLQQDPVFHRAVISLEPDLSPRELAVPDLEAVHDHGGYRCIGYVCRRRCRRQVWTRSSHLPLRYLVVRPAADMADAVILEPVAKLA